MARSGFGRRLLFAGVVLGALLGIGEGITRFIAWRTPVAADAMMDESDRALWGYSPGCHKDIAPATCIDSRGLRGAEPGPKKPGVRRALFVGDSSVFGVTLQDNRTFIARFAEHFNGKVEALNGGVPGYSSAQATAMLEESWLETEPDLLVIATLWSDNNFDSFVDADRMAQRPPAWLRFLVKYSSLVKFVAGKGESSQSIGWGPGGQNTMLAERRVDLATYGANLERMVAMMRERGGEAAFLILANVEDVERPNRPWPWDPYREMMRAVAARHGAVVVEAAPLWQADGGGRQLLVDDMHPSERGASVIGGGLHAALSKRGWGEGKPAMVGGNPNATLPTHDPWTEPWKPGLEGPSVAGVVQATWAARRKELVVRAYDPGTGALLDEVSLPAQAPFALDVGNAAAIRVAVSSDQGTARLKNDVIDLAGRKAWAVKIDLDRGVIEDPGAN